MASKELKAAVATMDETLKGTNHIRALREWRLAAEHRFMVKVALASQPKPLKGRGK